MLRFLPAGAGAGWGLHPLEKRRLFTAHVGSEHALGNMGWRAGSQSRRLSYSNLAGTEIGLVASTTGCPFIECPASTFITPSGVR